MERQIIHTETMLKEFREELVRQERARATIEKYLRDVRSFCRFAGDGSEVTKETVITFKEELSRRYKLSSANSILAAVNVFLKHLGWYACTVKFFRVQKEAFRSKERELTLEEYRSLVKTAESRGKERLSLIMQTLCAVGLRISELRFITAEAVREGRARVFAKGKQRTVLIPKGLCRKLRTYAAARGILSGSIFITRGKKPVNRSNVFHEMKALCAAAGVPPTRVFPHNLRHLFAVRYYEREKDVSHLADLLGHANINTTRIYTLLSLEKQERQVEALGLVL